MMPVDAERACAYVIDRARRAAPHRWRQGKWSPAFACGGGEAARTIAQVRVRGVERAVARGLVAWSNGERDVVVMDRVPSAREVLALQARGWRCVSLLDDGAVTAPHADGLAFALHDLCHLEKFVDPEHHAGQVGFFATLERAMDREAWRDLEGGFDDAWARDRDHVAADMNGSAIFLFAALKMKLKMAVRRAVGEACAGPLDAREERAFEAALERMLDALAIDGALRDDARVVSTRRDAHDAAVRLCDYFEAVGSAIPRVSGSVHTHDAVAIASASGTPSAPASPQRSSAMLTASGATT